MKADIAGESVSTLGFANTLNIYWAADVRHVTKYD